MQNLINVEPFVEQVDRLIDNEEQLITPQLLRSVLDSMVSELHEQWYDNVFEKIYKPLDITIIQDAVITPSTTNTFQIQMGVGPAALALIRLHPGDVYCINWDHYSETLKYFTVIYASAWDGTSKKVTPTSVYEFINGSNILFSNTLEHQGYALEEETMRVCNTLAGSDLLLIMQLDDAPTAETNTARITEVNFGGMITDTNEETRNIIIPTLVDAEAGTTHYYYEKDAPRVQQWLIKNVCGLI